MTSPKRRIGLLAFLAAISTTGIASAGPHPRLFFSAQDIPAIRARVHDGGPLAAIGAASRAGLDEPWSGDGFPKTPELGYYLFQQDRRAIADTVAVYAFGGLVFGQDGDDTAAHANQLAHDYLVGVCGYDDWVFPDSQDSPTPDLNLGHFLADVAIAYDFLYDTLSPDERALCQNRVAIEGGKMLDAAKLPVSDASGWWIEEYLQNHHWINHGGLGLAALAFDGEISADTATWLAVARDAFVKVDEVLDIIHGGAWHEGPGYFGYGADALISFSLANVRAGGTDYADVQILRDFPRHRLFGMPPAKAHAREYMVYGDYSGYGDENEMLSLRYVASAKHDGLAVHAASAFASGQTQGKKGFTGYPPGQRGMVLSALLDAESVSDTPPAAKGASWELDDYAPDVGVLESRSGWTEGGTLLGFKSGVFGGHANWERVQTNGAPGGGLDTGHDHDDDMSVYLFADGEWMTSVAPAYFIGRDLGPDAVQGNKTRYSNSLLVDQVGQLGEGVRMGDGPGAPWFWKRKSTIPIVASTAHYSFVLGAGSGLYDPSQVSTFGRAVLFLDREVPLVRDVVSATSAHRFDIVWHAIDGVTRDGDWLALAAKNDRALGVRVLSPAGFALDTESQSPVHLDKFDDDGAMTAAMVHPAVDTSSVTFLSALVPSRTSTWDSRTKVEPIDTAVPERGAVVTNSSGESAAVMADDPTSSASAGGISINGMGGARRVEQGKLVRVLLAAGTTLTIDAKKYIEALSTTPMTLEVDYSAGVALSGDDGPVRVYAPGAKSVTRNGDAAVFTTDGDYVVLGAAAGAGGAGGATSAGAGGSTSAGGGTPSAVGAGGNGQGAAGAPSGSAGSPPHGGATGASGGTSTAGHGTGGARATMTAAGGAGGALILPQNEDDTGSSAESGGCSMGARRAGGAAGWIALVWISVGLRRRRGYRSVAW